VNLMDALRRSVQAGRPAATLPAQLRLAVSGKLSRDKAATHGDPNHVSGLPDAAAEKMRPRLWFGKCSRSLWFGAQFFDP
jgi:hypothetical protein